MFFLRLLVLKTVFGVFPAFFCRSFRLVPQMQASFFGGILVFKTDRFSAIVFTAFVGPPTEAPFDVFPAFFADHCRLFGTASVGPPT